MKLRSLIASAFGVVALAQFATPASAITLINETFGSGNRDQFNIGVGSTVGSNFKVTAGNVDLIGNNGSFDLYPGNGNYIDLNGNTFGTITSIGTFSFAAGDTLNLSYNYGTNGAGGGANIFLGTTQIGVLSNVSVASGFFSGSYDTTQPLSGALSFVSTTPGFGGVVLDNIKLDKTTAVPEPFTIIGTIVGGTVAIRTRKKLKAAAKV
ncbi:hypothetical protein [Chamaesiphon sp.]|uniref:hypothetical protein n=1 Tax=Chamaesiphon sp. TaxID=2814140 RepID=UPI0035948244